MTYMDKSIEELHDLLIKGKVTSDELVKESLKKSHEIQEKCNDDRIDQVGKHGSDDGDDEEGLDGIVILIADCTHVGHRIGRGTKAETAYAGAEHGSIVVAA